MNRALKILLAVALLVGFFGWGYSRGYQRGRIDLLKQSLERLTRPNLYRPIG